MSTGGKARAASSGYYNAMEGLIAQPTQSGLNAAATAGIEIARNTLKKRDKAHDLTKLLGAKGVLPGLNAAGYLDEDDDED